MLPVTNTVSTSTAIGGSGGNSQNGIKLTNAKIVPKSESHKYRGPVYIVKNAANQRVLNMSGSSSGQNFSDNTFVTDGSNVGGTFLAASNSAGSGGGAFQTVSNANSMHAIRTTPSGSSSAVVSKSVIVVKPGQVVTTLQGSKPVTVGLASALGAAAGSTPIVIRGSTAGFIRAPVSLADKVRIGSSRPIVNSVVTQPTFVRKHQQQLSTSGNLISSTVRLTSATPAVSTTSVPSSANMYVLDVTNNVTNNNTLAAVSSAAASNNSTSISLNNTIDHRLTNSNPVLTSKAISVATSNAPSFWLQPKVSLGSNNQLTQNSQVVTSNNSTAAALVGKLVTNISNEQQLQLVSVVNNSSTSSGVIDEEANHFSILSQDKHGDFEPKTKKKKENSSSSSCPVIHEAIEVENFDESKLMQTEPLPPTEPAPPANPAKQVKQGETESLERDLSSSLPLIQTLFRQQKASKKKKTQLPWREDAHGKRQIKHTKIFEPKLEEKNKKKKRKAEKKFDCDFCHKLFKYKRSRTRHIEKMSCRKNKTSEIICEHCGKVFVSVVGLLYHKNKPSCKKIKNTSN